MEPGKYTSKQIVEYLKQSPYEEWVKVYNQLNALEVKTEDSNIALLVMDYIESVAGYTPQLEKLLKEEEQKAEDVIEEPEKMDFEGITDTKTVEESVAEIKTAETGIQSDVKEEPSCEPEEFRVETFTITM